MQNKGLIKVFAILLGLISVYQLSFTYFTSNVENKAKAYGEANGKTVSEIASYQQSYLDSVANKPVVFNTFTYNDIKDKAINLGLDLKGGINAVLQVSVRDILSGLANDSKNPKFIQALNAATELEKSTDDTYLNSFFTEFEKIAGDTKLSDPTIFGNKALREKVNFKMSNDEVKPIITKEVEESVNTALVVLRSRIDKFGVTQPSIRRIGNSGRILIELPGAKDIDRVKKLLQSTAELQFWEAHSNAEVQNFFFQANDKLAAILKAENPETAGDTTKTNSIDELLGAENDSIKAANTNNLFSVLLPNVAQNAQQVSSVVAQARVQDTAKVNKYLARKDIRALLSNDIRNAKFLWDYKPAKDSELIALYAVKSNRKDEPAIQGDLILDAKQDFQQMGSGVEVSMTMNSYGTKEWAKLTGKNVGKFVAVVLDDQVYSAPVVNDAITTGRTSISGGTMTIEDAQDLANVLKAGKLPAKANIIQDAVVGPSLGQKAIDSSFSSFALALLLVLLWMAFYYGRAGAYADVALILNILFIFGILSAFGAVLTLPGIAGIILTIGMAVDANVIIYERIKENLNAGQTTGDAVKNGFSFKGALSAIIDANVTTFLTGLILFSFGTGPVKGFAYTLMIGILTSLFCAVGITRLLINWHLERGGDLNFNTSITKNWFKNIDIEFLRKRKIAYIFSGVLILGGLASLFTNGLNYGVDFVGGRSYVVKFENAVNPTEVATNLKQFLGNDAPEVKTYGSVDQLKITTKYKIDETGTDNVVREALFNGVKEYLPSGTTINDFKVSSDNQEIGLMSSLKVEPTIADDIKTAAQWAVLGSLLVVFLYILFRFRKWQYSLGAVLAVLHDVLIVLAIFSLFYKVLPFDMEIGESFIAAILTVVGYSLNDTVVIFDRIREFAASHSSWSFSKVIDKALSSTLGRTINTSVTTLVVLLAIFLFGGDSIRGFMFALIVGVLVGTYSSLFIAAPVLYDTSKMADKKDKK